MVTKNRMMEFAPCIKCGSEDVKFMDCGYSRFNPYLATCKCGHEVKEMDTSLGSVVAKWNSANDPSVLLKAIEAKIEGLKVEAKNMKRIIAARNRGKKGGTE